MKRYKKQFLGLDTAESSFQNAQVILLPLSYEGGVSYGRGAAKGPDAVIDASCYLELYDEVLDAEPYTRGICTVEPPEIPPDPHDMTQKVYETTKAILEKDKFVILIGGDHSITPGYCRALQEKYETLSVIQFDAHADLRRSYEGSGFSHACVMSRIREITTDTLQIGIRSLSGEEAQRVTEENISICTMNDYRKECFSLHASLEQLPDPVFITFDVDVFDWSVIRSTGTPEPGGFFWHEAISLLQEIFSVKRVVGFDIVELVGDDNDRNSSFAAAKLIYKVIGFSGFIQKLLG
jgi:agmatinase